MSDISCVRADADSPMIAEACALFSDVVDATEVDADLRWTMTRLMWEAEASEDVDASPMLLPILACEAAGGKARSALPVAVAWRALHVASKLLDDVEDGDAARLQTRPEVSARIVNLATGFYAASTLCLSRLSVDIYWKLAPAFHHTILRMAGGQHRELTIGEGETISACLATVADKAGSFFALAMSAGACCGTSDDSVVAVLQEFGYNAGIVVQLTDDLLGFRQHGPDGDLANRRRKIPVIYALSVASPHERARLEYLLNCAVKDVEAEAQARRLMMALGADTYLLVEIARYRRRALRALAEDSKPMCRLSSWLSAFNGGVREEGPDAKCFNTCC